MTRAFPDSSRGAISCLNYCIFSALRRHHFIQFIGTAEFLFLNSTHNDYPYNKAATAAMHSTCKTIQFNSNCGRPGSQETRSNRSWSNGTRSANTPSNTNSDNIKGLGIALVAAQRAGVPVTLVDNSQASIDNGLKFAGKASSAL